MTDLKDKTLDELMAAPVTDELIREVSKRAWEVQGNCWFHNVNEYKPFNRELNHELCYNCGKYHNGLANPDITKPENFWPLAWKNNLVIFRNGPIEDTKYSSAFASDDVVQCFKYGICPKDKCFDHVCASSDIRYPGLAVAFAYLRIYAQSAEGQLKALDEFESNWRELKVIIKEQ